MNDILDEIDRAILTCLTQDARVSLKVLSARVGLTSPSTAERVKRLEERGVIQGYGARVNLAALGYSLQALVRVRPLPGLLQKVDKYIQAMPECIESDKVTGEDCFVMRLVVRDIAQLDTLLDGLAEYAQCNTSVVKSSPVKRRLPPLWFFRRRCGYRSAVPVASLSEARARREQHRWLQRAREWWGKDNSALKRLALRAVACGNVLSLELESNLSRSFSSFPVGQNIEYRW